MKKVLICIVIIIVSSTLMYAYDLDVRGEKWLPEYKTEKCLFDLLSAIVRSNARYYNPKKYYYSLEFEVTQDRRSMYIAPEAFNNARTLAYSGYINVKGMLFLCKGDYRRDSIFHRGEGKMKVNLQLSGNDLGLQQSFNEPSLEGTLEICSGFPIDISVYTKGRISGYEIK